MLIDTHTHIYLEDFDEDRTEIIKHCKYLEINQLLLPNIDSSTIDRLIEACNLYKGVCLPMVGLHPCSVKKNFEDELNKIKPFIKKLNPIAVGEIGIDLYCDKSFLNSVKR